MNPPKTSLSDGPASIQANKHRWESAYIQFKTANISQHHIYHWKN